MTALTEFQYELALPDSDGLVFGTEDTGYQTSSRPTHGSGELTGSDLSRSDEDGLMFGRDFRGGKTIGFEIHVLTDMRNTLLPAPPPSPSAAYRMNLDYLDALEGWWTDEKWREGPQSIAMLRACEGGVVRRCYGRPRRYDEAVGPMVRQGYSGVVCDFQMMDNLWYADVESFAEVVGAPPPDGGFIAPFTFPLTSTLETTSQVAITVGGTKPTWLSVEFDGPVLNPSVQIGDVLTVGLFGQLTYDDVVTVDPRPWKRTVLRESDGANFAGMLTGPAMKNIKVPPGTHIVKFSGVDPTATARVRLRWRDARSRP